MIFLGLYGYAIFGFATFVALSEKDDFTPFSVGFWSILWPVIWSMGIAAKLAKLILY